MKQPKNKKIKLKERRQHIFKCDEPDLQESAIFKKIVAYQRKLLVGHISHGFSQFHVKSTDILIKMQVTSPKTNMFLFWNLQNYFSRNFYNMRMLALFVAFAINFILLFYKVNFSVFCFIVSLIILYSYY